MSNIWPRVTRQNPCGICKKTDWCQIGDRGWRCYRVQSPHSFATGGWFHAFSGSGTGTCPPKPKPVSAPPVLNAAKLIREWDGGQYVCDCAADELGVAAWSLRSLDIRAATQHRAYAFPMRDGYGEIIGIRLRSNDGRKWAVRGSKNGLFIPNVDPQPVA